MYASQELAGALVTSSVTQQEQVCDSLIDKWVEVLGAAAGTFDIELSTDASGDTWDSPADLTGLDGSAIWYEVPQPAKRIRIKPTGLTCTRIRLRAAPGV